MRIVHVADSFAPDIGGIERQVETLVRHQMAQGHDVTLITAVAEAAPLDGDLDVLRAAHGRWLTVAFPWRNHRMVAEVLDGRPIDVLHAHFTVVSPLATYVTRAASRRRIPVAATVHSLWWQIAPATTISALPFGWGRMSAAWSAVSNVAATRVRRTLHTDREVSIVPNLIDTRWWRSGMPPHREPADTIGLVLVGRLKKRKHLDEIIDVLAQVRRETPHGRPVTVSIVGDGPRRKDLQHQIEDNGLTGWVRLLGYQDTEAVRALHHQSHLFIASSRQEAFGIAALEARAAGLPVLGYRSTGLGDYITHGTDGLLVADNTEMIRTLTTLIRHPEQLRRMLEHTATTPPAITTDHATAAIDDLYARARSLTAAGHHPSRPYRRAGPHPLWSRFRAAPDRAPARTDIGGPHASDTPPERADQQNHRLVEESSGPG